MSYKPAYIWNGTGWDQIGNQVVDTLDDYALLDPSASANQTITNTTLTSPNITSASVVNATISGSLDVTADISITGRLDVAELREEVLSSSISASVLTANYEDGLIHHVVSPPTANFTVNVTNVPTENNKSFILSILVVQGTTGYIPDAIEVDSVSQSIRWPNNTAPTPTSSVGKIDSFVFTFIRLSNSWIVLGNSNLNF